MNARRLAFVTSVLALFAGTAQAGEQAPAAQSVRLGPFSGVGYSIEENGRVRVVVILAEGETGTPLRIEALLTPGQKVELSAISQNIAPSLKLEATTFVGSELSN